MAQLVMRWKNDGKIVEELNIPEGVEIKNWMEVESPVDKWLDIIQYGLSIKREDEEFYKKAKSRRQGRLLLWNLSCRQPLTYVWFNHPVGSKRRTWIWNYKACFISTIPSFTLLFNCLTK